jgi:hypothetical protein
VSTWIDRSGTITAGGTAQEIAPANPMRRGFLIQNISDTDMWFNVGTVAVANQPSVRIIAGALYEAPTAATPKGALSVIGATTAKAFTAKEWNG